MHDLNITLLKRFGKCSVQEFACTFFGFGVLMVLEMNACQAVQQLRLISGLSQQAFASQLGMSVRAIANYEKDRTPSKLARFKLAKLARELDRADLASVLAGPLEIRRHREDGVIGDVERAAILALTLNRGSEWLLRLLAKEVLSLIKEGGNTDCYGIRRSVDRTPTARKSLFWSRS